MKILKKLLPLITAAALTLAGCTLPGERQRTEEDFNPDMDYGSEIIPAKEIINYTWFIEPTISAENIIVFDGSQIDTSLPEINKMYRTTAVVCVNGQYGFIDYNGSVIIKPKYKHYFIDAGGQIVLYNITNEKKGTREYCTMDKDGHVTDKYEPRKGTRSKYYFDEKNKKIYVSYEAKDWAVEEYKDKKSVIAQKASIYENYGRVELVEPEKGEGGYGMISGDKEVLLDFEYDDYYAPAYKGAGTTAFALKKGDKWGYFNAKGEKLIDIKCDGFFSSNNGELSDDIDSAHPYLYSEDLLAVSIGSSFGYYNIEGGCLVKSSEFSQARPVHHLKAWVCKDGYWGIISFGEDDEEPVTTTTTTTTTAAPVWQPAVTTAEDEDDEDDDDDDEYWYQGGDDGGFDPGEPNAGGDDPDEADFYYDPEGPNDDPGNSPDVNPEPIQTDPPVEEVPAGNGEMPVME